MVTVIPARNDYGAAAENFGRGIGEGYEHRTDEAAIRKALTNLKPDASPRDVLNTLTNTQTYHPEAKQNALKNFLGVAEYEAQEKRYVKGAEKEEKAAARQKEADEAKRKKNESDEDYKKRTFELNEKKAYKKDEEKREVAAGSIQTIADMRALRKKGNLGRGVGIRSFLGGEVAKDKGAYEQFGKSLISQASPIVIRNKAEFDTLAHKLYDSSLTDSEAEGILNSLEDIIKRNTPALNPTSPQPAEQGAAKVRVRNKQTGATGSVTPFEGMEAKYELIK